MEDHKGKRSSEHHIVLSSRVRLARNLDGHLFPGRMSREEGRQIAESVRRCMETETQAGPYAYRPVWEMEPQENEALAAERFISRALSENRETGACLISRDESACVLINEEDHIRIQTILPGLQLERAWRRADALDEHLAGGLAYAFDETWGYLTACPTNVGTGMRASVLLHLPALVLTRHIRKILETANTLGLAVRGLYGEGTRAEGDMFQISNQITLGKEEAQIIGDLDDIVRQIIAKEQQARSQVMKEQGPVMEDRVWRALGILKNARLLNRDEAMKLLSRLRLGIDLGLVPTLETETVDALFREIQAFGRTETLETAGRRAARIHDTLTASGR